MHFFKNFDWSGKSIAKLVGMVLLGVIGVAIAISLIGFALETIFNTGRNDYRSYDKGFGGGYAEEAAFFDGDMAVSRLSVPQAGLIPEPGFSTGTDAENFEVKSYNGSINTRKLDKTCDRIAALKDLEYVIFESSNKNDENCNYRFKVKKENEQEIVDLIEGMDPEIFNANITSIKKNLEGVDSELEILKKKLTSIEETLEDAQDQYDSISVIATRQQDAETLASIIDSKLNLIEKLTSERLNIKAQIDRYNKSKADQLDRLDFTFFSINVYKDVIFDWKQIKDDWKWEVKNLVRNVNDAFQAVTVNLVTYIIRFAQAVIYLFLSVFLLKFVWMGVKKIWTGNLKRNKRK